MKKDYLFKVRIIEDIEDSIWKGSMVYVKKELKNSYCGEWTSRMGTYTVKVPKNKCVKLDDIKDEI
jgi:hypothetical protein